MVFYNVGTLLKGIDYKKFRGGEFENIEITIRYFEVSCSIVSANRRSFLGPPCMDVLY